MQNIAVFESTYSSLLSGLRCLQENIIDKYPFDLYVKLLDARPHYESYRYQNKEVIALCKSIENDSSTFYLDVYHRCLLLRLILLAINKNSISLYPKKIKEYFELEYMRIASEVSINSESFYRYDNDLFCKDLAICTHRMFPVGVLKIEALSGIPRSVMLPIERKTSN